MWSRKILIAPGNLPTCPSLSISNISFLESKPHQHQQNPTNHCYQTVLQLVNFLIDYADYPLHLWLEALKKVCEVPSESNIKFDNWFYSTNKTYWKASGSKVISFNSIGKNSCVKKAHHSNKNYLFKLPEFHSCIVGIAEHVRYDFICHSNTNDALHIISQNQL